MLERFKLGQIVTLSFVLVAMLIVVVGAVGYLAAQEQDRHTLILVTVAATLATVIWGMLLARSITGPLSLIVRMSQEIGQRHLGMRLRMNRTDEIGLVAHALNQLADDLQHDVVAPLKKAAAGDLTLQVEPRDSQDEIALAVKKIIGSLQELVAETGVLAQSVAEGKLAARGKLGRFQGGYKTIIQQINHSLDSVTEPLQIVAQHMSQLAAGNIPPDLTQFAQGDWIKIQQDLNVSLDAIRGLTSDCIVLSQAAAEGKLATQTDLGRYHGDFRIIAQNMNNVLRAVADPLSQIAERLNHLADGQVPSPITDPLNGDFETLKRSLNQMIGTAHLCQADSQLLMNAATEANLAVRADIGKYPGQSGWLLDRMNRMMDALSLPLSTVADRVAHLAQGEIPPRIPETYRGDFQELRDNLNVCIDALSALSADVSLLSGAASEGRLAVRANVARHQGEFRKIVQRTNDLLDAVTGPLGSVAACTGRIANGEIPPLITEGFLGDWVDIRDNLNACAAAVSALLVDMDILAQALTEGRLAVRMDASRHRSRFHQVIQNANHALGVVADVVNDVGRVITQLADGNLQVQMDGHYRGDWAVLRDRVETLSSGLRNMAHKTRQASFGMAEATAQILASSTHMVSTARQQAGAVLDVTNTVQETRAAVGQSVQQAQEMARVISELASVVEASAQAAQHVVKGVEQETARLDQISSGIDEINRTVQYALETAQQWQSMAQNLMVLSEQLKVTATHYRFSVDPI